MNKRIEMLLKYVLEIMIRTIQLITPSELNLVKKGLVQKEKEEKEERKLPTRMVAKAEMSPEGQVN